jgi:folate-binding protein YgfZ
MKDKYFTITELYSGLKLSGENLISFLHNNCTNNIKTLKEKESIRAYHCNAKGMVIAPMEIFLVSKNEALILCFSKLLDTLHDSLSKYSFFDDITIETITWENLILIPEGTLCDTLLRDMFQASTLKKGIHELNKTMVLVHPLWNSPSVILVNPNSETIDFFQKYETYTDSGLELFQIQNLVPLPETELIEPESIFAPELNQPERISYNKGCYLGQNAIGRCNLQGGPKKILISLEYDADLDDIISAHLDITRKFNHLDKITAMGWMEKSYLSVMPKHVKVLSAI